MNSRSVLILFVCIAVLSSTGRADDAVAATPAQIQRVKDFAVMGYEGIRLDLDTGKGPYLATLVDLLKIPDDERETSIGTVRSLCKDNPNIMDFADKVAALTRAAAPAAATQASVVTVPTGQGIYSGDKIENALNHMTRAMPITVYLKTGGKLSGRFDEFNVGRLWIRGASRRSVPVNEIAAVEAPEL